MTEPSDDPTESRADVLGSLATTLRQPSFLRVILFLAATVVVLAGIRLGAPILNPIFFAVVLTLLFSPVYAWLKRRGLPTPLALVVMLVGLTGLFLALFFILSISITRFSERVGFYVTQLDVELDNLDVLLERLGLSNVDLQEVVNPSALAGALGVVLSGIAGFLSDLFLILMITLFLLGEGSAMMNRLRASVHEDNAQVSRLATVGQSFVPYIGLVLAVAPAVVLALAEFGADRALLVAAGVTVINVLAENLLSPMMMGRGLNLSPTVVFLSFILWAWLLGGPGAFLAVPITLFLAVMFDTFPET